MEQTVSPAMDPPMQSIPAIIFSDLDGTLLDHHDYGFDAAVPALQAVHAQRIPLILTTSKTLAEVDELNRVLDNRQAVIVENGGALCFPGDRSYPFEIDAHEQIAGYSVIRFSPPYRVIRGFIEQQRGTAGRRLLGFGDMTVEDLMALTGLDAAEARLARQRLCSEPFLWRGTDEDLAAFRERALAAHLHITRGGRFWHLMGDTGKAEAMRAMRCLFTGNQHARVPAIALGDAENDREMLEAADIAVIIRRPDGTHLDCHGIQRTLLTELPGPAGWNQAILRILPELRTSRPTT